MCIPAECIVELCIGRLQLCHPQLLLIQRSLQLVASERNELQASLDEQKLRVAQLEADKSIKG